MMAGGIGTKGRVALAAIVLGLLIWAWLSFRPVALDASLLAPSVAYETAIRDGVFERSRLVPGQKYEADDDRFRILPLYAVWGGARTYGNRNDINSERQHSPRPIRHTVVQRKLPAMESLVILPKWRWGVAKNSALHPELLIALNYVGNANTLTLRRPSVTRREIWGESVQIISKSERFSGLNGRNLYTHNLQTILAGTDGDVCEPTLTVEDTILLGRCKIGGGTTRDEQSHFWLLTDPDLLNNLGIGFADNAAIARDLLTALAADRKVILDTTTTYSGPDGRTRRKGPDLSELTQYFAPPYTGIWIAAGALLLLMVWHALRRSGPLRAGDPGRLTAPGQTSRATTIAADASLMAASTSARDGHELARLRMEQGLEDLALALHLRDQDATHRASKNAPSTAWPRLRQRLANVAPEELAEIEAIRAAAENRSGDVISLMDRFQSVIAALHPHFQNKARP
ncbi:MAG: hypothetical protein AAFO61_06750 [Pseudomonadota bacterium]